jgi:hypothetical protein
LNVQKCCTSLRAERLLVTGIGLESKIYSYWYEWMNEEN